MPNIIDKFLFLSYKRVDRLCGGNYKRINSLVSLCDECELATTRGNEDNDYAYEWPCIACIRLNCLQGL